MHRRTAYGSWEGGRIIIMASTETMILYHVTSQGLAIQLISPARFLAILTSVFSDICLDERQPLAEYPTQCRSGKRAVEEHILDRLEILEARRLLR